MARWLGEGLNPEDTSGPANLSAAKWNQLEHSMSGRSYDEVLVEHEKRIRELEELVNQLVTKFIPEYNV